MSDDDALHHDPTGLIVKQETIPLERFDEVARAVRLLQRELQLWVARQPGSGRDRAEARGDGESSTNLPVFDSNGQGDAREDDHGEHEEVYCHRTVLDACV